MFGIESGFLTNEKWAGFPRPIIQKIKLTIKLFYISASLATSGSVIIALGPVDSITNPL